MAQIRDYRKLAHDIICEVGGKENIVNATRCATRLRLVLKKEPGQAKEKVAAMAGVITVVENSGQFQVVIGTHVGEVYDAVAEELHVDTENLQVEQPKQSVMNKVIATMSAVFAPFVYILAAAGLLQGALILVNMAVPSFAGTGTYAVLSFMSWTPFTFLPIFIAITASKHFKCNTFIAVLCCCASGLGIVLSGTIFRKETARSSKSIANTVNLLFDYGSGNHSCDWSCIFHYGKRNCKWI